MHKKIVSTCSPNNNMYWVCIQCIVKKFPDGLFLVNPYVLRIGDIDTLLKCMYFKNIVFLIIVLCPCCEANQCTLNHFHFYPGVLWKFSTIQAGTTYGRGANVTLFNYNFRQALILHAKWRELFSNFCHHGMYLHILIIEFNLHSGLILVY